MNDQKSPPNHKQVQLRIADDVLKGNYANAARISHTPEGFVLDFINVYAAEGVGVINSRLIVNPQNMKAIAAAIQENLKLFDQHFAGSKRAVTPAQPTVTQSDHTVGFDTTKAQ